MLLLSHFTLSLLTLCGLFNSACWLYLDFLSMGRYVRETTKIISKMLFPIQAIQQGVNHSMYFNTIINMMIII